MASVSTSYLRRRSELLLPRLSAVLVIEFIGVGELTGEKVLRCFGLICWDGGLRLGCTVVIGQVSYLSLKVIFEDVSSFAAGSSRGMGLIFSGNGPVSLLLLRAGGWMAPLGLAGFIGLLVVLTTSDLSSSFFSTAWMADSRSSILIHHAAWDDG
jgi:hypothetical protein